MLLKEFIAETLKEIINGTVESQEYARTKGSVVNPTTNLRTFTEVDFDVAVSTNEGSEKKAGGSISVWSVKAGGVGEHTTSHQSETRIKFKLQIELPREKRGE